jgi:HAD superfamily hydrolase (TIGR01509 family)
MKNIKAVIFDMDGLMLDSERMAIQSLERAGANIGLDFTEAILEGCIGLNAASTNIFLAQSLGRPIPQAALSAAFDADYKVSLERNGIRMKAGLIELLDFLRNVKMRLAVVTSTATVVAEHKLSQVGVMHYFEFIVGGDVVTRGKPAPDPYLLAATRLGMDVSHCLALEDSDNGVRSALAANMKVIIVPDIKPPEETLRCMAVACVESLHHVRQYFAQTMTA